jgi:polysaccharide pyruvyl transferase CsaB
VSGYIGFDNFGDEAIAHVLTQKLKNEGAESITLISSNPEKTKKIHDVNSCGMLKFLPSLIKSDVLISGGGSLLQDVTSVKSLFYYLGVIYSALLLGKKVEIFAQGIGPINSKIGQLFTKPALKRCTKISVRDKQSQEYLNKWNIKSELVNDPILDIELPHKNNHGCVGIQLRKFNGVNEEFLNNLAESLYRNFSDKSFQIFSLQDSVDLEICNIFKQKLLNRGIKNIEVLNNLQINEVFEGISNLEYLVSMRFHAGVVGVKSGVRTLVINYDPKVQQLAKQYNLPVINLNQSDFSKEFEALINF